MTFDFPGYDLRFIQKQPCNDGSAHLFTVIYKFYSPVTKYLYVVRAEFHRGDVFAIKFYCKKDKRSDLKYSKIINRGDVGNIITTCAKAIPLLLLDYPLASFAFGAASSVDEQDESIEPYIKNQRFELYKYFASRRFGQTTFAHYEYPLISSYLLLNRKSGRIPLRERELIKMFSETYNNISEIN